MKTPFEEALRILYEADPALDRIARQEAVVIREPAQTEPFVEKHRPVKDWKQRERQRRRSPR